VSANKLSTLTVFIGLTEILVNSLTIMGELPHKNIRAKWFSVRGSDAVISAKKERQIIKEQTNDPLKSPKYWERLFGSRV
jgi:hypothetical protein